MKKFLAILVLGLLWFNPVFSELIEKSSIKDLNEEEKYVNLEGVSIYWKDSSIGTISDNNGRLIVKGVLQRAESKNQNGRVYPKETLVREAKKYAQVQVKERRALGELDHPDSSVVNLNNVSHNILEMHWSGDDLEGTVEVLGTPAGNILKELFKSGIKLGISSRGLGSVEEIHESDGHEPVVKVQPDFELIAFDFVSSHAIHLAICS